MKAILISVKPKWVAKILNGEKIIEIRKSIPKCNLPIDVYIYCGSHNNHRKSLYEIETYKKKRRFDVDYYVPSDPDFIFNSKVVAKFTLNKVEPCYHFYADEICDLACISHEELYKYAGGWYKVDDLYAWHIDKLEILKKPKLLSDFWTENKAKSCSKSGCPYFATDKCPAASQCSIQFRIKKAPQSWCYVEVGE